MSDQEIHENLPVPVGRHVITPLVKVDEAVQIFREYERLKSELVTPTDIQTFKDRDGKPHEFLKKSYWRKLGKVFGVSVSIEKEWKEVNEPTKEGALPTITYYATVKATAPNGQFMYGDGACNTGEKGLEKTDHNTRSTAVTRAKNRAISDLVGGGEVSAEEVDQQGEHTASPPARGDRISEAQAKRLFAIAKKAGYNNDEIKGHLQMNYGVEHTADIQREWYEQICEDFEKKTVPFKSSKEE